MRFSAAYGSRGTEIIPGLCSLFEFARVSVAVTWAHAVSDAQQISEAINVAESV